MVIGRVLWQGWDSTVPGGTNAAPSAYSPMTRAAWRSQNPRPKVRNGAWMEIGVRKGALWLVALGAALVFAACNRPDSKVVDDGMVIEDVTLISPERQGPLEHAAVVIQGGRIAQVGTGIVAGPHAKRIDGRGRFLIPGLIDSHVHAASMGPLDDHAISAHPELLEAYRAQLPRSYLAFGFTTLVDLDLREGTLAWFNRAPVHPNFYHCGRAVHIAGGYGALRIPKDAASANRANLVYEAAQAKDWPATLDPRDYTSARAVERVVEAGGVCLKTFVEPGFGGAARWPVPRPETLEALRAETLRRGLVFVVHANSVDAWRAALEAHADVIAHGLWHWPGDRLGTTPPGEARDVIQAAARAGAGVQPTLQAVYGDETIFNRSLLDDPRIRESLPRVLLAYLKSDAGQAAHRAIADEYRQAIRSQFGAAADAAQVMATAPARATASLRMMEAEKVKLLFGSDTPSNEGIGNPPGLNGRLEMTRWSEAGVPLSDILRAATVENAAAFGLAKELGTIEVGKRADLLLVRGDPLRSIAAYDSIETVFLNGHPIERGTLLPVN
jgi:imidazolonepropionase-like amidohydrolase